MDLSSVIAGFMLGMFATSLVRSLRKAEQRRWERE